MKPACTKYKAAFAMTDLIVCVAAIVFAGLFLPMMTRTKCSPEIVCVNNLRQVAIGFRLYANDGESYPQFNPTNEAWVYFQVVGKEIGSPKIMVCPQDKAKQPALDFETNGFVHNFSSATNRNNALSYFYGVDANENDPNLILAGDRNLAVRPEVQSGLLLLSSNSPVRWSSDIHTNRGQIVLTDGSAQVTSSEQLRQRLGSVSNAVQRLILP